MSRKLKSRGDERFMDEALRLARRGLGFTSPNPVVGALLVRNDRVIGRGWHRAAGLPHAEIEAIHSARVRGEMTHGATLYVTLEPCSTHGRTPPCVDAIVAAGIRQVVAAATDPNPKHSGRGFELLRAAGVRVASGTGESESQELNAPFNHWIVHRSPWVMLKAAMTLDGKIATATGESRWITGPRARGIGMRLRHQADAVLAGVNTVLADDPELTVRDAPGFRAPRRAQVRPNRFRIVLDTNARTPISSRIISNDPNRQTLIVVGRSAPGRRIAALEKRVKVLRAPERCGQVDLRWLMDELGSWEVVSLLVEGGGEVHASFIEARLAHEISFLYAPIVLGGKNAKPAVAGTGFNNLKSLPRVVNPHWSQVGDDLLLNGRLSYP